MDTGSATVTSNEEQLQDYDCDDLCILEYIESASLTKDTDGSCSLQEEEGSNDSCILEYIEILPLRDTGGSFTTECVGGDRSAEVTQENVAVVKEEPDVVCCTVCFIFCFSYQKQILQMINFWSYFMYMHLIIKRSAHYAGNVIQCNNLNRVWPMYTSDIEQRLHLRLHSSQFN